MKVWAIKAYGHYGGGMAIVAAKTSDAAIDLAVQHARDEMWGTDWRNPTSMQEIEATAKSEGVLIWHATGE